MTDLNSYYDIVAACNRCGFCTSYCPTYNSTGSESYSPRGRNQIVRALIEGKLKNPAEAKNIVDTCLLCGECTSVCFSEVPTAELMVEARQAINKQMGVPFGLRIVLGLFLPHPKIFRNVLRLAFMGKRLGFSWLLRKMGILQKLMPTVAVADELIDKVPFRLLTQMRISRPYQERTLWKERHNILIAQKKVSSLEAKGKPVSGSLRKKSEKQPRRPSVAFMPACGGQYLRPSISVAVMKILKKMEMEFLIPDTICCGLPAASYGVLKGVRDFAKKNIKKIEQNNFDHIIVDDSSCAAHYKDYPTYFKDDPEWFDRAQKFSSKIKELSSFLVMSGFAEKLKSAKWTGGPVAFHDPCKAQYGQKITRPPRQLLEAVEGLVLVPVPDSDQCCGGGGTYSFVHPEMSRQVLEKKVSAILETGAQTVVTTAASCLIQIASGLKRQGSDVQILHLSEFLLKVLK